MIKYEALIPIDKMSAKELIKAGKTIFRLIYIFDWKTEGTKVIRANARL